VQLRSIGYWKLNQENNNLEYSIGTHAEMREDFNKINDLVDVIRKNKGVSTVSIEHLRSIKRMTELFVKKWKQFDNEVMNGIIYFINEEIAKFQLE
jgi:hypothetical protein